MMDLLSVVAYYDAYLCRALQSEGTSVTLGAITYHLDPGCFKRLAVTSHPGLIDFIGRFKLPGVIRRPLKVMEMCLNMLALAMRFTWMRPHVVHVQYLPLLERRVPVELWFLRYCRFLGSSLVCTIHDILPHDGSEVRAREFKKAYGMMDALVCHSDAVKQQLTTQFAIAPDRIWVIPHGPFFFDFAESSASSVPRKSGPASADVTVLCQGMIRPYKGIDFLLDAWSKVRQSGAKAKLVVAGNGEPNLLNALREKVCSLGLESNVELCFRFLSVEEMLSYYRAADIVVYPYKTITTSGALMTGITQRKAIVATSLPPFREILQHGKNALLCDYGDTARFASALLRLINDSSLRNKLADEAATLNLGSEAWRQIAAETKRCYASVSGQGSKQRVEMRAAT
jgi:glycosyltransferase involved in cell wall biosynthesis